jgi:putative transposase
MFIFRTLNELREKGEEWMFDYNNHRPHDSLNNNTPADLLQDISTKFYFECSEFAGSLHYYE